MRRMAACPDCAPTATAPASFAVSARLPDDSGKQMQVREFPNSFCSSEPQMRIFFFHNEEVSIKGKTHRDFSGKLSLKCSRSTAGILIPVFARLDRGSGRVGTTDWPHASKFSALPCIAGEVKKRNANPAKRSVWC